VAALAKRFVGGSPTITASCYARVEVDDLRIARAFSL
jgi:hypothetical protein